MGKRKRGCRSIGQRRKQKNVREKQSQGIPDDHAYVKRLDPEDTISMCASSSKNKVGLLQLLPPCGFVGDFINCDCIVHQDESPHCAASQHAFDTDSFADEYYLIIDSDVVKYESKQHNIDDLRHAHIYEKLKHALVMHEKELTNLNFNVLKTSSNLHLVQFYENETTIRVKTSVTIDRNLKPVITVHEKRVPSTHDIYNNINSVTSFADVISLATSIGRFFVCIGNPEEDFVVQFQPKVNGRAYVESGHGGTTVRSMDCTLYTLGVRCKHCIQYRGTLRSKSSASNRALKSSTGMMKSSKPNCSLSRKELEKKTQQLKSQNIALQHKNERLKKRLHSEISKCEQLSESESNDIKELVEDAAPSVKSMWTDPHSFQRIFWDQQVKYNNLKHKSAMRWHPLIIKWALLIKSKSSKAYQTMRETGFVNLPSQRTLYDYSHCVPSKMGFVPEATEMLINECKAKGMYKEKWSSYVGLLQDEIKIKDDLVYCPTTGQLIGFIDLDDTSNQILEMESGLANTERKLANSVLVLMVRGATTGLKFPLAAFATNGLDSSQLFTILWKAVEILEIDCSLKVLFITCDGAGQNRKFFDLHKTDESSNMVNKYPNPYAEDERSIFFISDVPHLLKTTRNCFANSGSHRMSRKMWKDGKDIRWMHIVQLYEEHVEQNLFSKSSKLTRAHIDLTSFSQMKVNLAAQVLSNHVAVHLESEYGEEVSETVKLLRHMNKFFDCLNTRNLYEGKHARNRDLDPYDSVDDERLRYLTDEFLGYFHDWKRSVENRQGDFTQRELAGMQLSQQTLDGLQITISSIVDCVRFLLKEGAPFVLTAVFNQDDLEQHFGHYRHKGGANDAPTVNDIRHTMTSLRVIGSTALAPLRGNTKRQTCTPEYVDTPLPRKKSKPADYLLKE